MIVISHQVFAGNKFSVNQVPCNQGIAEDLTKVCGGV